MFEAWTSLARHQHKLDLNNDALASANKALQLISENKSLEEGNRKKAYARAWAVRGAALSTMAGKEVDALAACDEALANDQNNVDALYYKGRVYTFQERDTLAHSIFDHVIQLDPNV